MEATLTKINQLKQERGIDVTSEYVLGIDEPPEHQCLNIDEVIKRVKGALKDCDYSRDYIKDEDLSNAESYADDVYHELYDLEDAIEKIRTEIENVRAWGQEWKDLAKKLINETDVKIEEFV
ncbi:hypothetical protein ACIQZG_02455 [Lysinibacillus sp. NPDC096418]|uniref:hypothetical protein n=1 Tax=Lysinibacillus sp. NPDC096418 TaxID=3364138 RepID=UPI0038187518